MKLTDLALMWAILTFPLVVLEDFSFRQSLLAERQATILDRALHASLDDAAAAMISDDQSNDEPDELPDEQHIRVQRQTAVDQFWQSLNAHLPGMSRQQLSEYVPFVIVMEYAGFGVYAPEEYRDATQKWVRRHVWQPMRSFVAADHVGNSYRFTAGERFRVRSVASGEWQEMTRAAWYLHSRLSQFADAQQFHTWKNHLIMLQIETEINRLLNDDYRFSFSRNPRSGQLDTERTNMLTGIGILACLKDVPDARFITATRHFAFAGAKITRRERFPGFEWNGKKVYARSGCLPAGTAPLQLFERAEDAAASGFYPIACNGTRIE